MPWEVRGRGGLREYKDEKRSFTLFLYPECGSVGSVWRDYIAKRVGLVEDEEEEEDDI
jgi:hypothetical protein